MSTDMTKSERTDLCTLIRRREKIEKSAAAQRSAEILADFERQLATIYSFDQQETWAAANAAAQQAIKEGNLAIQARCSELGIPKEFAPGLSMGWNGRGENASRERRAELRAVVKTRIDAMEKSARTQIETRSLELQEEVIVNGLTSDAAAGFLAKLPSVASLMPAIEAKSFFQSSGVPFSKDQLLAKFLGEYPTKGKLNS